MVNLKEIKRQIKALKILKKRADLIDKKEINKKLSILKMTLKEALIVSPTKQKLIDEILKNDKLTKVLGIDLKKFSEEELKKHLKKLTEKGRNGK